MRSVPLSLATAAILLAGGSRGIHPRAGLADYPTHESFEAAAFGAAIIPPADAKRIFAADLNSAGYVVIEVGVFPVGGREVDLSPLDFTLLTDPNTLAERPADADAIASVAVKQPASSPETKQDEVSVTAGASIAHESYPDPVTGRRVGVTATTVGAGVGVGAPADRQPLPASTQGAASNRDRLERQLWEESLPDGKTASAVAGYLYFPKPSKKARNGTWVLQWENAGGRVSIPLSNPWK